MQQNTKCRIWIEKYETINHVITKCSDLAKKEYQTRHNNTSLEKKKKFTSTYIMVTCLYKNEPFFLHTNTGILEPRG